MSRNPVAKGAFHAGMQDNPIRIKRSLVLLPALPVKPSQQGVLLGTARHSVRRHAAGHSGTITGPLPLHGRAWRLTSAWQGLRLTQSVMTLAERCQTVQWTYILLFFSFLIIYIYQ